MKTEFQNSIVRLNFLCCITDIKIVWLSLCPSHCPHTKQFYRAHNRVMLDSKFAKKGHYIKCLSSNELLSKRYFYDLVNRQTKCFLYQIKLQTKFQHIPNTNILGLKSNML